jgi:hypothetical protein
MHTAKKYLCTFFLAALPLTAIADGSELLEQCQELETVMDTRQMQNPYNAGMCLGTVKGVRGAMVIQDGVLKNKARLACFPPQGISEGQAARVVLKYLRDHPESLHEDEVVLTMLAFRAAFPCKR